jgi:50S ribosomal protein L16 3-hydroxylase
MSMAAENCIRASQLYKPFASLSCCGHIYNPSMEEALLGGLSPKLFLRRHWQKRPLFVRQAVPGIGDALSRNALFDLATRDDVESRLVQHRGEQWCVTHGPLTKARLKKAGARDWSLLVNGVNHHHAAAERLLRRFSFVPQARLDDVMVSYAAPGGGVGPHVDSYDVFLIQGSGRRRWRIAPPPGPRGFSLVANAPLKLIAGFRAREEFIAEPGDLLYLPPGWGHDGVALEACFTYSVGFRAPAAAELSAAFLDHLHERGFPDASYADPGLQPARHPARISADLIGYAERQLARIRWQRSDVADFLGRFLSNPKPNVVFRGETARGKIAVLDPRTQLLYAGKRFFINGESFVPRAGQRAALALLADHRSAPFVALKRAGLGARMHEWQRAGFLHLRNAP